MGEREQKASADSADTQRNGSDRCEPFGVASLGETCGSVHVVGDSGDGYTERKRVEESLCRFAPRVAMVQTTQARR